MPTLAGPVRLVAGLFLTKEQEGRTKFTKQNEPRSALLMILLRGLRAAFLLLRDKNRHLRPAQASGIWPRRANQDGGTSHRRSRWTGSARGVQGGPVAAGAGEYDQAAHKYGGGSSGQ
jgi:hypothetical protein